MPRRIHVISIPASVAANNRKHQTTENKELRSTWNSPLQWNFIMIQLRVAKTVKCQMCVRPMHILIN